VLCLGVVANAAVPDGDNVFGISGDTYEE